MSTSEATAVEADSTPKARYVPTLVSSWDRKKQAMVDNETLSTTGRAAVYSISASMFKLVQPIEEAKRILAFEGRNYSDSQCFNFYVDPLYYMSRSSKYEVSDSTVEFTMRENRTEWRRAVEFGGSPKEAITAFRDWFHGAIEGCKYKLWANSPNFDIEQLLWMGEVEGVDLGLDFRSHQDMRTIRETAELLGIPLAHLRSVPGYKSHTGVADVFGQILHVNNFFSMFTPVEDKTGSAMQ